MPIDLARVRVAGSAEELRGVGVDPRRVYSCGPERPGVKGCPLYDGEAGTCELQQKDETGVVKWIKDGVEIKPERPDCANLEGAERHGPGPLNIGARKVKMRSDGTVVKVVNVTMRCWEYPYQRKQWLMMNEAGEKPVAHIAVIAIEGQKIALPGTQPQVQPDGKIIHRIQPKGVQWLIRPLERPSESDAFAANIMATAEIERDEQKARSTRLSDVVKLKPGAPNESATTNTGATRGGASSRG